MWSLRKWPFPEAFNAFWQRVMCSFAKILADLHVFLQVGQTAASIDSSSDESDRWLESIFSVWLFLTRSPIPNRFSSHCPWSSPSRCWIVELIATSILTEWIDMSAWRDISTSQASYCRVPYYAICDGVYPYICCVGKGDTKGDISTWSLAAGGRLYCSLYRTAHVTLLTTVYHTVHTIHHLRLRVDI